MSDNILEVGYMGSHFATYAWALRYAEALMLEPDFEDAMEYAREHWHVDLDIPLDRLDRLVQMRFLPNLDEVFKAQTLLIIRAMKTLHGLLDKYREEYDGLYASLDPDEFGLKEAREISFVEATAIARWLIDQPEWDDAIEWAIIKDDEEVKYRYFADFVADLESGDMVVMPPVSKILSVLRGSVTIFNRYLREN